MGEFHGLDGLEDAGIVKGPQEKATEKFINRFREGKEDNAMADFLYSSMLSIARNIDAQNNRGREISRNMTSLLGYIQQLETIYPSTPSQTDDRLEELMAAMAK